jgi:hypothetical protein
MTKLEVEGFMEVRKVIRMQVILMGLGAALLLASSAHAQQDMDPSSFDVNPGTPHVTKVAAGRAAQGSAEVVKKANSAVSTSESILSGQETKQEADLARLTMVDATMVLILMAGVGLIVLYAMAATKRERRLEMSPQRGSYSASASSATAL